MITYKIKKGTTDVSVVCRAVDSTDGTPETAFDHSTTGIDLKYRREGEANTDITEAALAALTTAHTNGGVEQIGNGYFRLDLPDGACATGADGVLVHGTATGMVIVGCYIQLVDYDPFDSVRMGMTALPNAAAGAAGGLPTDSTGKTSFNDLSAAQVNAEVDSALDTAVPGTPTAGSINERVKTMDDADIPGRLPAALVSGRMSSDAVAISGNTTAADNVQADYDGTGYNKSASTIGTVTSVGDKTGYALSAAGVDAIIDETLTSHVTADSLGVAVKDILADTNELQVDDYPATLATLSTHSAADVWAVGTRVLTAGTNLNDLSTADIDARLAAYDAPTYTELLNFVRLILRGDAALATDLSAEITTINTNLGSGAGSFANTTDAQEALRDWIGDGTNLTEAGGTGDHLTAIDLPDQTMNITGNLSGSVGSVTGNINTAAGTIQTLDALDTAQDTQHSQTQTDIATAQTDLDTLTAGVNVTQISGDTNAADKLEALMDGTITAQLTGSPSTTSFPLTSLVPDITGSDNTDQLVGRLVTIISGARTGEQTDITAWDATTSTATVTAVTAAPSSGDLVVIH